MAKPSHQTVRLSAGKHRAPAGGVCVMELASMLAEERFSDRPKCVSRVVGAFLRTYNDGIDADSRQDLYAFAARAVGTKARRAVERRRVDMCLELAARRSRAAGRPPFPWAHASLALGSAEAAGAYAARSLLLRPGDPDEHRDALAFLDRLVAADDGRNGRSSSAERAPVSASSEVETTLVVGATSSR